MGGFFAISEAALPRLHHNFLSEKELVIQRETMRRVINIVLEDRYNLRNASRFCGNGRSHLSRVTGVQGRGKAILRP